MTATEFVTWFKGFVAAANTYNITPKQWDSICEELEKVKDNNTYTVPVGTDGIGVVNTTANIKDYTVTYKNDVPSTNTVF